MKIACISGSRNPQGQTARAVQAVAEGITREGAETDLVFLPALSIERCRQCEDSGWGLCRSEGRCIIEDDFADLVEQLNVSDGVVFATPVYFSDLSESIRAFLDRLRRISMDENSTARLREKPALCVAVAGGGGGGAPSCLVNMEKIVSRCGFHIRDVVPVRRQNLDFKAELLRSTGAWFAAKCSAVTEQ